MCLTFLHYNSTPFIAKLVILKQVIIPTMTYGMEIWGWNDAAALEMDQPIADCMRAVLGATKTSQGNHERHAPDRKRKSDDWQKEPQDY